MDTSKLPKLLLLSGLAFMALGVVLAGLEVQEISAVFGQALDQVKSLENLGGGRGAKFMQAFGVNSAALSQELPSLGELLFKVLIFNAPALPQQSPNYSPAVLFWFGIALLASRFVFNFLRKPQTY